MSRRRMPKAARIHLLRLYERLARPMMFATVSPAKRTRADEEIAALLDKLGSRCFVLPPGLKIEIQAPSFRCVRVDASPSRRRRGVTRAPMPVPGFRTESRYSAGGSSAADLATVLFGPRRGPALPRGAVRALSMTWATMTPRQRGAYDA